MLFQRVASIALCVIGLCCAAPALGGGGPEHVFLIVNTRDQASLEVANRYVELRKIPPTNVFYLPWPAPANNTGGLIFREKILKPILAEIKQRGLEPQIDQIVYSTGYPWQLDFSRAFASQTLPTTSRPTVSLTGATYLHQFVLSGDAGLVALNSNDYCAGPLGTTTTKAFRGSRLWVPGGVQKPGGTKYLLATALGFTTPGGNTVHEITSMLEKSAAADGTRPRGTVYYMLNGDVRTAVRKNGFLPAIAELSAVGIRGTTLDGVVPNGKTDVAGLTTGSPQVPLSTSNCRLLPGALVDNLTSAGGQLYKANQPKPQTRVSEYVRMGAAGASGTVVEPYAIPAKFPSPALHVHYARGATMAEAFYQSVQAPFQLLVVGDPLCQPWAVIPRVTVAGVPETGFASGTIDLTPSAAYADSRKASRFDLYVDGVLALGRRPGEKLALDTTKLSDGHHELRVVAVDTTPIECEGRWIGTVMVKNGRDAVELALPVATAAARPAAIRLGAPITVVASSTASDPIVAYHNEREVGRAAARTGLVTIDSKLLGRGRAILQARVGGPEGVRSRPLELTVE